MYIYMICNFRQGDNSMLPYDFGIHSSCIYLSMLLLPLFKSPVACCSPLLLSPYPWSLFTYLASAVTPGFILTLF